MNQLFSQTSKALLFVSFVVLTVIYLPANAQRRSSRGMNAEGNFVVGDGGGSSSGFGGQSGWSVALNVGYEAPHGDVKYTYKAAPTAGFSLQKKIKSFTISGTVDYRSYSPKKDTTLYTYDGTHIFTARYSNYKGLGLYLSAVYDLQVADRLKLYGGLFGGSIFTSYKITLTGEGVEAGSISESVPVTYLGPKLGFNVLMTESIGVGLEGRYSLGVVGANYNTRDGGSTTKGYGTYAGNLFLTYNF